MKLKNKSSKQNIYIAIKSLRTKFDILANNMTFLNFSQLLESVFHSNFLEKHFPGNQAKFSFDWKVFSVDQLS
jgi:hypothetical protein